MPLSGRTLYFAWFGGVTRSPRRLLTSGVLDVLEVSMICRSLWSIGWGGCWLGAGVAPGAGELQAVADGVGSSAAAGGGGAGARCSLFNAALACLRPDGELSRVEQDALGQAARVLSMEVAKRPAVQAMNTPLWWSRWTGCGNLASGSSPLWRPGFLGTGGELVHTCGRSSRTTVSGRPPRVVVVHVDSLRNWRWRPTRFSGSAPAPAAWVCRR